MLSHRERFVGLAEPFHQVLVDWQAEASSTCPTGAMPLALVTNTPSERPEVPKRDVGACRWQSPAGQGGLDQLHVMPLSAGAGGPDDLPSIEAANIRDAAFGDDRVLTVSSASSKPLAWASRW